MKDPRNKVHRTQVNRRAFLRGAGGALAIGLPFLEGLPERSAWAQNAVPTFGFFLVGACGVVQNKFWPTAEGPLSESTMSGTAVAALAPFADDLLLVGGVNLPGNVTNCGHAQGLCGSLTGVPAASGGQGAQSSGISADMVISKALNPQGVDPLTLYSGAKSYIGERISFAGPGAARSAQVNPYAAFQGLLGISDPAPSTPSEPGPAPAPSVTDELLIRRQSVNDTVLDELASLRANTRLSQADKDRLSQHMEAVRLIEENMMSTGADIIEAVGCTTAGINTTALDAFKGGLQFTQSGNMIEDIVKLHGEVVALSFSCNQNRVATLQWGDGTDATRYSGIGGPGWPFHQISHRVQSDAQVGVNADAEAAHAEIDALRMGTLAHVVQVFKERGLLQNSFVYWTNHVAEGSHTFRNVPAIIAGNAGGYLKQGEYLSAGGVSNGGLLSALIASTGAPTSGFGGGAELAAIKA